MMKRKHLLLAFVAGIGTFWLVQPDQTRTAHAQGYAAAPVVTSISMTELNGKLYVVRSWSDGETEHTYTSSSIWQPWVSIP